MSNSWSPDLTALPLPEGGPFVVPHGSWCDTGMASRRVRFDQRGNTLPSHPPTLWNQQVRVVSGQLVLRSPRLGPHTRTWASNLDSYSLQTKILENEKNDVVVGLFCKKEL